MEDKRAFFEKVIHQVKLVMKPNIRKLKPNHPDLIGFTNKFDAEGNDYVVLGWIHWDPTINTKVLKVVISKKDDQEFAQKLYKGGGGEPEKPKFKMDDENDLPI
jgi:hypothetical protein